MQCLDVVGMMCTTRLLATDRSLRLLPTLVAITITMQRRTRMGTTYRAKGIRLATDYAAICRCRRRTSANALTMFWLTSRWTLTRHAARMCLQYHSRRGPG